MLKTKLSYFLLIFLLISKQTAASSANSNTPNTQEHEKEIVIKQAPSLHTLKRVTYFLAAVSGVISASLIYQRDQRHKANPGFSYTSEDGVHYSSDYKLSGKSVSEKEYRKAMSVFYVPFYGGFLYLKALDPFENTIQRAAPKFDSLTTQFGPS